MRRRMFPLPLPVLYAGASGTTAARLGDPSARIYGVRLYDE